MAAGTIRYSCESQTTRKGFAYADSATLPIAGVPNELAAQIASSYSGFAARSTSLFGRREGIAALESLGFVRTGGENSPIWRFSVVPAVTAGTPATTSIQNLAPSEPVLDGLVDAVSAPAKVRAPRGKKAASADAPSQTTLEGANSSQIGPQGQETGNSEGPAGDPTQAGPKVQ
jgi:hypothetical protein